MARGRVAGPSVAMRLVAGALWLVAVAGADGSRLAAQAAGPSPPPPEIARERAEYGRWLAQSPVSPRAAVAQAPIGEGLSLGPETSDVPLAGVGAHRIALKAGRATLVGPEGERVLPRGRPLALGDYRLVVSGPPSGGVLTVYRSVAGAKPADYFPYDPAAVFRVTLERPERPGRVRVLALDGVPVEAEEAGTIAVRIGGATARLTVRRLPGATEDESELQVFFRDETNGRGTYPAGRFVELVPGADESLTLDLNRARNPFCAYSSAYPCPAPWRGNAIAAPVRAGERYAGGGLESPAAPSSR